MDESQTQVSYNVPSSLIISRKLDTALRDSTVKEFRKRQQSNELTKDDKILLANAPEGINWDKACDLDNMPVALLLEQLIGRAEQVSFADSVTTRAHALATHNIRFQMDCMANSASSSISNALSDHNLKKPFVHPLSQFEHCLSQLSQRLQTCVERFCMTKQKIDYANRCKLPEKKAIKDAAEVSHWYDTSTKLYIIWSSRLCLMRINNVWVLHPRAAVLMLHNKVSDILSVSLTIRNNQGITLESNAIQLWTEYLYELIDLALTYKRNYYTIVKNLEGFAAAEALLRHESWLNNEYLNALDTELHEDIGFKYSTSRLRTVTLKMSTPMIHEVSCLGKVLGHPLVDMRLGAEKLFDATRGDLEINNEAVASMVRMAKHSFIENYVLQKGTWPPISWHTDHQLVPNRLKYAWQKGISLKAVRIANTYSQIVMQDMDYIKLLAICEYTCVDNIIPFLKDKIISLRRSEVLSKYFDHHNNTKYTSWDETRVLLVYLLKPDLLMDHHKYLQKYLNAPSLKQLADYLIIRIVPKEKELKLHFRGFGCKTFEDRLRGSIQEDNAAKLMDQYCHEQAMTLSELQIMKKLSSFRHIKDAYPGHKALTIVVDASKWNNRQRHEVISPLANALLDPLMNTTIFSRTHEAFQHTFCYIPDEEETYYWDGQDGGIEGQHQYTWDWAYIPAIKSTLQDESHQFFTVVKGDDLKMVILVPPGTDDFSDMKGMKARIVTKISQRAKQFGHKIKVEESYGSERYFSFSKQASIGPILLPQTSRKIQKVYGSSNAFLPFLDDMVAAAFSNVHSATQTTVDPISTYFVACFWMYLHLCNHGKYRDSTDDQMLGLSLVPSLLGGFPIIYIHNMFVRAESDLLSPFLHLLMYADVTRPRLSSTMKNFLKVTVRPLVLYGKCVGVASLCEDPYSLPIAKPDLPSSRLRSLVRPVIEDYNENRDIKQLVRAAQPKQMDAFFRVLNSASTWNGRVFSALYSCTPGGLLNKFLRKFESARSINELFVKSLGKKKADRQLKLVIAQEQYIHEWRVEVLNNYSGGKKNLFNQYDPCPGKFAANIRKELYLHDIEGVTMPPLQHQVKITTPTDSGEVVWDVMNHFSYHILPETESVLPGVFGYSYGGKKPFLGYATTAGTTVPQMNFVERDDVLSNVKNLVELADWCSRSSPSAADPTIWIQPNVNLLVDKLIKQYLDVPLQDISPFAGQVKSGTIQHHVRAPKYRESIVPNTLTNIYTRILSESDTHVTLSDKRRHVYVNFLHVMCYTINILSIVFHWSKKNLGNSFWSVTTDCSYCNRDIYETPIQFDEGLISLIQYHPIQQTMVSKRGRDLFMSSVRQMKAKRQVLRSGSEDNCLSLESGCMGVLQEIVDHTIAARSRLRDATTRHHINTSGETVLANMMGTPERREIGTSELKCMPLTLLFKFVMNIIQSLTLRYCSTASHITAERIIRLIPAEELPWFPLTDFLSKSQRLNDLVVYSCRITKFGLGRVLESTTSACKYLGYMAWSPTVTIERLNTVIYLSKYEPGSLLNHIMIACRNHKVEAVREMAGPRHKRQSALYLEEVEQVEYMASIAAACLIPELDEDFISQQINEHAGQLEFSIQPITAPADDIDCCLNYIWEGTGDDTLETESGHYIDPKPFHQIVTEMPHLPWQLLIIEESANNYLELIVDTFTSIWLANSGRVLTIINTDFATCLQAVRRNKIMNEQLVSPSFPSFTGEAVSFKFEDISDCELIKSTRDYLEKDPGQSRVVTCRSMTYPMRPFEYPSHRTWTIGNSSCSRMIEIIYRLNMQVKYPKNLVAVCLADGFGSFSTILSLHFPYSYIFYSSLQRVEGNRCIADSPMARSFAELRSSAVDTGIGVSGIGDLGNAVSMDAIPTYVRGKLTEMNKSHVSLVCNDMDWNFKWDVASDVTPYIMAMQISLVIAAQLLTEKGIGIFKVCAHTHEILADIWEVACHLFGKCKIIRLKSSAYCSRELYIITQGPQTSRVQTPKQLLFSGRIINASIQTISQTRTMFNQMMIRLTQGAQIDNVPLKGKLVKYKIPRIDASQLCTGSVRVTELLGVNLHVIGPELVALPSTATRSIKQLLERIIKIVETNIVSLTESMTAIRPADRRAKRAPIHHAIAPSIGLDTRAHNREIGYVIVASVAFVSATRSVLNQIQVNIDSPRLFRANMQNEFISTMRSEDYGLRRFNWHQNINEYIANPNYVSNLGDRPGVYWSQGYKLIQYLLPYTDE